MKHQSWLAVGLTTMLLFATACGPKDDGRTTTPPRAKGNDGDPTARPGNPDPRTTPPKTSDPRTPPVRRASSGPQCPAVGGAGLTTVIWPDAKAHLRRFHNETRLDKVITTKATPVEVCGGRGQIAWLLRARCPDGTAPFPDGRKAHASRSGSVGPGGRCGKVVDLYKVSCGGAIYSVFMSLYHCTSGQRFP